MVVIVIMFSPVLLYIVLQIILLLTILSLGMYFIVYQKSLWIKISGGFYVLLAIVLFARRDTFLPFLGEMAFPKGILKPAVPEGANGSIKVSVDAPNGTPVVYWGAESSTASFANPTEAYKEYKNAGIALVNDGKVEFRFRYPASYYIPYGSEIKEHIHFRVMKNGLLSNVKTVYLSA